MSDVRLEHVNISVQNSRKTAQDLCTLFDWHIRWEGVAGGGAGYAYHVGNHACYIALYTPNAGKVSKFQKSQPLNHILKLASKPLGTRPLVMMIMNPDGGFISLTRI